MTLLLQVADAGFAAKIPLRVVRDRELKESRDAKAAKKRAANAIAVETERKKKRGASGSQAASSKRAAVAKKNKGKS